MAEVQRSTTIPAEADRVWDAVLRGDWLGEDVAIEPWPGGDGVVLDRGEVRHVVVETVDPGRRLTYRWWGISDDGVSDATRVVIDVEPLYDQTRVVIIEAPAAAAPLPPSTPMALAFA